MASLLLGVQENDRPGPKNAATDHHDHVEISDRAKEIHRIQALVQETDVSRTDKIKRLQQAIDSGTYQIGGRIVGDALIRRVLTDTVL